MKFQNRRVKRAEKTTATTIERKKERWRVSEREKERPIRWTMMMLVTERTSNGVRIAELNERMMDGWTPLQGQGNKRTLMRMSSLSTG
jgi:hypothetical protein